MAWRPDGTPFDHIAEVRDAQRGLLSRIDWLEHRLSYLSLSSEERDALTRELGEASRLLDYSEEYLPR